MGQFSQRPEAAGGVFGRAPRSAAGENFLGSRWGRNSQNLRSREGFCKKLKGWRGVWGAALAKFLILMLFYVFLHHFLSIFLIFNNFLSFFFLCFPLFFVSFGSLQPCQGGAAAPSAPPWWGSDMPGWGCCPICPPPGYALGFIIQNYENYLDLYENQ